MTYLGMKQDSARTHPLLWQSTEEGVVTLLRLD